jgi:sigma-B regulation protein RsbU (phosphoserine phosphatase)
MKAARLRTLRGLAVLFAVATLTYAGTWMYAVRQEPALGLGTRFDYSFRDASIHILATDPEGPAARAGLRVGDRIVAVDGESLRASQLPLLERLARGRPGAPIRLTVERDGAATADLTVTLEPRREQTGSLGGWLAFEVIRSFPLPFLVVGLAVLFLRTEDQNAWLLFLLFACFIASAPLLYFEASIPHGLRGFALAYKVMLGGIAPGLFLYLFSVFPSRSPLDARLPWLKHAWLFGSIGVALPLGVWVLAEGSSEPLGLLAERLGYVRVLSANLIAYFGGFGLGLLSLFWNARRAPDAEARRRSQVVLWSVLLAVLPGVTLEAVAASSQAGIGALPFWVWASAVIAVYLLPFFLAYAIVKHRVLEIPVLLRRSARYLLVQRGFLGLLLLLSVAVTLLFSVTIATYLESRTRAAMPLGIALGAAFGTALLWAGSRVQRRVRERIDRAFFRSAYDARNILQDLVERTRAATDRRELLALMQQHVHDALMPRSLAVYVREGGDLLRAQGDRIPPGLETLSARLPIVAELESRNRPWETSRLPLAADEATALGALDPECLVPMLGRDGQLGGLLVLGQRRSEEPYSGEDKRLLLSVASQAGLALESFRLAEQMAERLEAERRTSHEMALARQVQLGLLPQQAPSLDTLECAGDCVQTRAVGGDYFDFVDVEPGRLGLVLADISGKGFPAALLMASLQASLRSRPPAAFQQLPEQLQAVNQLLYRYSAPNRFATLFFGLYDDRSRLLRYVNCGHNPPMLLRSDGSLERLMPTAMVLGLLEPWESTTGEVDLGPGDLLAVYSDGVTEAFSDDDEEFGEERLLSILRQHHSQPLSPFVHSVIAAVQEWSGSFQEDDLTLLLARGRGGR